MRRLETERLAVNQHKRFEPSQGLLQVDVGHSDFPKTRVPNNWRVDLACDLSLPTKISDSFRVTYNDQEYGSSTMRLSSWEHLDPGTDFKITDNLHKSIVVNQLSRGQLRLLRLNIAHTLHTQEHSSLLNQGSPRLTL